MGFLIAPSLLAADGLKVSPFALYEKSAKNILIDGVSTQYGLGVLGVELQNNLSNKFSIAGEFGYGQNNSQKTSFGGANFEGKVTGSYVNFTGKYDFYENDSFSLFSTLQITRRKLNASNLIGSRNGLALTGTADTTINSEDLTIGTAYKASPGLLLKFSAGLSRWHIKSNAAGYYSSNGVSATAKKNIDTTGHDPIYAATIKTNNVNHNFALMLSNRSLRSKANTEIITGQLQYTFEF